MFKNIQKIFCSAPQLTRLSGVDAGGAGESDALRFLQEYMQKPTWKNESNPRVQIFSIMGKEEVKVFAPSSGTCSNVRSRGMLGEAGAGCFCSLIQHHDHILS